MSGDSVDFTKRDSNDRPGQEKILYQGQLSHDASLITGQWTLMSIWTGRFRMRRANEQKPKAISKVVLGLETEKH